MQKLIDLIERISPILVSPNRASLTISLSRRFFLFQLVRSLVGVIEDDPHLNFIALLKNYKILGHFLSGTVREFYRDRNRLYFKNFFYDRKLYRIVKKDIESLYPGYKDIMMTITKRGLIVYDNYKKNRFNVLLLTLHSGTWIPEPIEKKLSVSRKKRKCEEDAASDRIYRKLVLENAGIWIDNKQSRFVIDFNRSRKRAIYADNSEEWLDVVWKKELTKEDEEAIHSSYRECYFTLTKLLDSYTFNIIFDGHTMNDRPGRPDISIGTKYIPSFYMPIVRELRQRLSGMGYEKVSLNKPYKGGNILRWMRVKFPNIFIFSMEINKRLYSPDGISTNEKSVKKLSDDIFSSLSFQEYEPAKR